MTAVLGIDPGESGGISVLADGQPAQVWKMPPTERDVFELMEDVVESYDPGHAYIEKVHSMPRQGVASSFKFGMGYGGLRMALLAAGIPFSTVIPARWQRTMQCLSRGEKNVTKARAQEIFPSLKITHAIADALLIAAYGYRDVTGKPWTGG